MPWVDVRTAALNPLPATSLSTVPSDAWPRDHHGSTHEDDGRNARQVRHPCRALAGRKHPRASGHCWNDEVTVSCDRVRARRQGQVGHHRDRGSEHEHPAGRDPVRIERRHVDDVSGAVLRECDGVREDRVGVTSAVITRWLPKPGSSCGHAIHRSLTTTACLTGERSPHVGAQPLPECPDSRSATASPVPC